VIHWVEERCEMVRVALCLAGFPTAWDAERLEAWLEGCVTIRRAAIPRACIRYREDGGAVITLPEHLTERALEEARVEECGHYLIGSGLAAFQRAAGDVERRYHRIARSNEVKDEAVVRQFMQAWFLPSSLLDSVPADELPRLSGCSHEIIETRLQAVRGRAPALTEPPRWSAAREYELQLRSEAPMALLLVPRGTRHPEYQILVTRSYAETAFQVWADLCALTTGEFRLKYAFDAVRPGRRIEIPFETLLEWGKHPSCVQRRVRL